MDSPCGPSKLPSGSQEEWSLANRRKKRRRKRKVAAGSKPATKKGVLEKSGRLLIYIFGKCIFIFLKMGLPFSQNNKEKNPQFVELGHVFF